jgi:hypothetical protein
MSEVSGIGSYGIYPFLSEDVIKQAKFSNIKSQAGRIAYILSLGEKAPKPVIEEGLNGAKGALKWIKRFIEEDS